MGLIHWIIFAVCLGIIASFVDSRPKSGGIFSGIILSVTGTLLALFLSNLIFNMPTTVTLTTVIIALYGAAIFLLTGRGLRHL